MARVMTSGMVITLKIGQSAAKSLNKNKKKVKQGGALFIIHGCSSQTKWWWGSSSSYGNLKI